jgi:small subunit ribosomal protein S13
MVRIAGVEINKSQLLESGLKKIYGIGRENAKQIIKACDVLPHTKFTDLSAEELQKIRTITDENYVTEGQLKRLKDINLKRLKRIGSLRGRRHRVGLPVRGQRTRTNSRTTKKRGRG